MIDPTEFLIFNEAVSLLIFSIHGEYGIGKRNAEGRMLLDFCVQKELCVANTWYKWRDERKVTYSSGGNDTEVDFVLVGKEKRKYLRDVKVIPGNCSTGWWWLMWRRAN